MVESIEAHIGRVVLRQLMAGALTVAVAIQADGLLYAYPLEGETTVVPELIFLPTSVIEDIDSVTKVS